MDVYFRRLGRERGRARFVRDMLFFGCLTGKRIRQAFGEELLESFVFEEVSTQIGSHPSSVFPPEEEHVLQVLTTFKPHVVVTFGAVAKAAVLLPGPAQYIRNDVLCVLYAPHPAARGADVVQRLRNVATGVQALINGLKGATAGSEQSS